MTTLYSPLIGALAASLLAVAAAFLAVRSARLAARALRDGSALDLVRGIRTLVLSLVSTLFAVGVLSGETGFLVIGAIILAEELYETGILFILLRWSERAA
jgi:hypothetical protein